VERVSRIAAVVVLTVSLALALAGGAEARPAGPARTEKSAASIKAIACQFLDTVDTAHMGDALINFVREGEFEASALFLFGVNRKLCGEGTIEKLWSSAHNFLSAGLFQHEPAFSKFQAQLPSLQSELAGLSLPVATVSVPTLTFSRDAFGPKQWVPTTVTWATSAQRLVYIKAVPLSPGLPPPQLRRRQQFFGTIGSIALPLPAGEWQLCSSLSPSPGSYRCGFPFSIKGDQFAGRYMSTHLGHGTTVHYPFVGSQVPVVAGTGPRGALVDFNVDQFFGTYRQSSLDRTDRYGNGVYFFAYWAWNLGPGAHTLNATAVDDLLGGGSSAAGHIYDIITIS